MFEKARVGDRVWSVSDGWGTVKEVSSALTDYKLHVKFENKACRVFTFDGKQFLTSLYPILFWDEVKIIPPPIPKRIVKKEGWVNIYKIPGGNTRTGTGIYNRKEEAILGADAYRFSTIKIEWEEEE